MRGFFKNVVLWIERLVGKGGKEVRYVVWNGSELRDYEPSGASHDYSIPADAAHLTMAELRKRIPSVQQTREALIAKGLSPVVIFACQSGGKAGEIEVDGKTHGLFSYVFYRLTEQSPPYSLKELIVRTNEAMLSKCQIAEVVCTEEALEKTWKDLKCVLVHDACRVLKRPDEQVV